MARTSKPARDLHAEITDRIITAIEAGTRPWKPDWSRGVPPLGPALRSTGEEYRGINQLLLTLAAFEAGYPSSTWMTFKQAKEFGGSVRAGERSTLVVFYKLLEREETDGDTCEERTRGIPMLRSFNVFNVAQIEGLPERFAPAKPDDLPGLELQRDGAAEAALRSSGAEIREGGARAFYHRTNDTVTVPDFERFHSVGGYLATMAHELVHWTGAPHRLDRTKGKAFGDAAYAFEELVAEIGAAFLCGRLGVAGDHIDSHASYVDSWLQVLKADKRAIFRAAAQAQTAADMVLAHAGDVDRRSPVECDRDTAIVSARLASPMRPAEHCSAPIDGLPLFDSYRSPTLF